MSGDAGSISPKADQAQPRATPFSQDAAAVNEALLISGLHQHELTDAAQKLNIQLQREISERKLAEMALQEAKDRLADQAGELERLVAQRTAKLRETVGELETFSYSLAHDMRAPLRSMRTFSQILLKDFAPTLDPRACDFLQRICRSSNRLDRLIQDVLNYTKILGEQFLRESVDLDRLLRDLIDTCPDWQSPRAELHFQGTLPKVLGSEAFLTQCLSNLLSNAVKFVAPATIPQVQIWAELNNEKVRLCIRDNGIGIASDKHARVFRMFERIHPASEYEGTGIGLTIAHKAIERMDGEIGFESEPGRGSLFWILLKKG